MKKLEIGLMILALAIILCGTVALAQSQAKLNDEACSEFQKADEEMNSIYKQILIQYKDDSIFIEKLKVAQRAWLLFRDAHLESLYPEEDKLLYYGSVYSMCRCIALAGLTRKRTEELKLWLTGMEEGDVCGGSIRINN
jgi:uncharacterized protein YecT (DUF1311 family)